MEISKKTLRNIFLCAAGCIILYWLLHETERIKSLVKAGIHVVSPFVVGAAMAFILNVPMRGIERLLKPIKQNGLRRAVAIVLTLLVIVLVLAGVIEPYLSREMLTEMNAVGGVMLIATGMNVMGLHKERIQVGNMLPALLVPVVWFWLRQLLG